MKLLQNLNKKLNYFTKCKFFRLIYYKFKQEKYKNFYNLKLNKDSLVLDFGANVGEISQFLFDNYKCNIKSYEPNKYAFEILKKRFLNNNKVNTINKAIDVNDRNQKLYYHKLSNQNPYTYSTGSSLLKKKTNINVKNYQNTKTCSIKKILKQFKTIDLIKIDIEGYEYKILPDIIKNKNKIKMVICELHGNPKKLKNKFLNKKYINFIKKLDKLDPERKWFLYHY